MSVAENIAGMAAVVGTLVGAPLTVMILYLKAIRDQQSTRLADCLHRVEALDAGLRRMADDLGDVQRDAATKEEWIRENMWNRGQIERLSAALAKCDIDRESLEPLHRIIRNMCHIMSLIERRFATGEDPQAQETQ
jgi:hypothetical protein